MTSQAVMVDGSTYLVDCGGGASRQIVAAGIPYSSIRALFITHLHGDHVMDYPATILGGKPFADGQGFSAPAQVYGPEGTESLHAGVLESFSYTVDIQYAASRLGPGKRELVQAHDIDVPDGSSTSSCRTSFPSTSPVAASPPKTTKAGSRR